MVALAGRDRPAAVLEAEISRTVSSHGGLVFVAGEAGIGKTTLVAETLDGARRRGALVANGTCWEREGAPGYWAWVQVLRALQRTMAREAWAAARASASGEVASLLGEVDAQSRSGPAGDERFGLHDAVTTLLVSVSRRQPLVVVLDDLHWADPPSVRLLGFVARHAWFEQLLVIGTYRDDEIDATDHPLSSLLLPLVAKARSVTLTGLDRDDVGVLLARTAGRQPDPEMVTEVHRRTGGNPFFVAQTAHLWQSTNSFDAIAPGVRDAIQRRLGLLPEPVLDTLTSAAVLGPEFDREVLAVATGTSSAEVAERLGRAVSARLVMRRPEAGGLQFVHDLVREALYRGLSQAETQRLHAAVVRAYEQQPELARRAGPAELAHHAYLAGPDVPAADAVALLRAAARDAWARMASDEAAVHLRRALESVPGDQPRDWAAVALDLGSTQHHLREGDACLQTLREVSTVARKLGDAELLARAALRLRGAVWLVHPPEIAHLTTDLINEAHAMLIGDRSAGGDGQPRSPTTDLQREQELTARAIELARDACDDDALVDGLIARHDAIWAPETAAERQAIADELELVAMRRSDRSTGLFASLLQVMALLEQGHPGILERQRALLATAGELDTAFSSAVALWSQVTLAALTGRFEDARAYVDEVQAVDARQNPVEGQPGDIAALRFQQRWTIDVLQGRLDDADAQVAAVDGRGHPYAKLFLAITAAERGDLDRAREHASTITEPGEPVSRWFGPLWLRLQARLAAAPDAPPQLRQQARAKLAGLGDHWLAMFGSSIDGPAVFWRALIDAAEGHREDAVAGFAAAAHAAERLGARPWTVRARAQLAEALLERASRGDQRRAASLLDQVEQEATEIGVEPAAERARQLRARLAAVPPSRESRGDEAEDPGGDVGAGTLTETTAYGTAGRNVFRFDGQVWTLGYQDLTVHLPDAKGLRDIHVLISRAGSDVRAMDLAGEGGEVAQAVGRLGADPVLDEKAKVAYRNRLSQLDEHIELALDQQDDQRAAELDRERAELIGELRRATGLGGRPRRLGDEAERARKAVFERIRNTLQRLDRSHPALALHLRASISTGAVCRYEPDDEVGWDL